MAAAPMRDEDLEYHIKFPSPGLRTLFKFAKSKDSDGSEYSYMESEPIVFLIGWFGCEHEELERFDKIYSKRCICILYNLPKNFHYSTMKPHELRDIAKKLLGILFDLGYEDNPIFIHALSHGGGMIYRYMSELMQKENAFQKVHMYGAILDSLPVQKNATAAYRTCADRYQSLYVLRHVVAFGVATWAYATSITNSLLKYFGFHKTTPEDEYIDYMYMEPPSWPTLYLYSKNDAVLNHFHVESVIDKRVAMGAEVTHVCWDDSPHLQLYLLYEHQYAVYCRTFIHQRLGAAIFEDSDEEFSLDSDSATEFEKFLEAPQVQVLDCTETGPIIIPNHGQDTTSTFSK